jgi:hypothetical protein
MSLDPTVLLLVLLAAVLHATWNASSRPARTNW